MNNRVYYSQEAEQQVKRQQTLAVVLFTALGITVGAIMALLFAPKSGDRMRRELSSTLNEGVEASNDALKQLEREFADFRKQVDERLHS